MSVTIKQIDALMRGSGFKQTEAAGDWRWYEFPPRDRYGPKQYSVPAFIRAQFYEPASDFRVWVVVTAFEMRGPSKRSVYDVDEGYVDSTDVAAAMLRRAAELRLRVAVAEMARENDARVTQFPALFRALYEARTPSQSESAHRVLADALLDHGVPF